MSIHKFKINARKICCICGKDFTTQIEIYGKAGFIDDEMCSYECLYKFDPVKRKKELKTKIDSQILMEMENNDT